MYSILVAQGCSVLQANRESPSLLLCGKHDLKQPFPFKFRKSELNILTAKMSTLLSCSDCPLICLYCSGVSERLKVQYTVLTVYTICYMLVNDNYSPQEFPNQPWIMNLHTA